MPAVSGTGPGAQGRRDEMPFQQDESGTDVADFGSCVSMGSLDFDPQSTIRQVR